MTTDRPMRLRRSELSTPASNEKMIERAAESAADLVFLDLEDSVAPSEKVSARQKAIHALNTLDWGKKVRAVRMNSLETPWAYRDVIDVVEQAGENLDVLIVPKVYTAADVLWVDTLLTQIEANLGLSKKIGMEVLIEEVKAMINVESIATSTPRLEALIFGPGDYSASQGVKQSAGAGTDNAYPGDIWHYARNKIVIAARAAGIEAVDGPYANFRNPDGYRKECTRSYALGAVGKWAIHPSQIEVANEVYSPTKEQVERARKMVAAYEEALKQGLGSIAVDGVMVDAVIFRSQQPIIDRANLIGM